MIGRPPSSNPDDVEVVPPTAEIYQLWYYPNFHPGRMGGVLQEAR